MTGFYQIFTPRRTRVGGRFRATPAALLVLLLSARPQAPARALPLPDLVGSPLPEDPMQVTVHRLSNGMTVYLSPNRLEPRVSARIVVRTGSLHDPEDGTGMAHYLEHMLFKGSERLGALDYAKEKPHLDRILGLYEQLFRARDPNRRRAIYARIDAESVEAARYAAPNELDRLYSALGFQGVNAFTSEESTSYVGSFPSNRAEAWARVEAERFSRPVFRLFQTELEAVYEEKNRSLDNAERTLGEAVEKALYASHPYGRTVLGSIEHLKNPSLARMYAFYRERYRPGGMAVVLSGDFERAGMLALLERHLGSWRPGEAPADRPRPVPPLRGERRVEVRYEAEEKVVLAWPTVPHGHPDEDAVTVMDMVLDNAQAGILNLKLNQAQKVKASGSSPEFHNEAGSWQLWAVPKKGQSLEQAEALLLEAVRSLQAGEFDEGDLRAVLTAFEISEKRRLESNEARVSKMAEAFAAGESWPRAVDFLGRLRRVSRQDVLRVARKYLGHDRVVAYRRDAKPALSSIQKPSFTPVRIDPSRRSAFFEELLALKIRPIEPLWLEKGRDYEVLERPWGRLYWGRNPVNDLFDLTLHFDRGLRQERDLCAALDLLELSGAGTLDAEAYKKELYRLGATLSASCGEQESSISLSGLEKNYDDSLRLMLERFESPRVATDTLRKMIEVQIGAHRDRKKDPGAVFQALAQYAARGQDSPVLFELTDGELAALKEQDLRKTLRRVLDFPRDAVYVGARASTAVAAGLSAGRSRFEPRPARRPLRYLRPGRPRVLFTHRDMVQSRVGIYASDGPVDPALAVDYQYYNAYMDGDMSGVFFQEVRESRSLAYSAHGGYDPGDRAGDDSELWAFAGCQADKTVDAASLLRALLLKPPLSPERFATARGKMEEDYRADRVHFRSVPGTVLYWNELGLDGDPRPRRFQRVLSYRLEDLARFAERFAGSPLSFYVLGHRARAGLEGLRALGEFEERPIDSLFPY